MVAITVVNRRISPKTLVLGIVIGQTKSTRPIASAFNSEMIITIFRQFTVAAGTF